MKNSKISFRVITLLTFSLLAFSACHKKNKETTDTTPADTEQSTVTDNNLAENTISDIDAMGGQVSDNGNLNTFRTDGGTSATGADALAIAPCATITGYGTNTITVNFGTAGCLGSDGRMRTGKLIYTLTGASGLHYRNPGFSMNVTSQNYVVDSVHVNIINKTVTNTTPASVTQPNTPLVNLTWSITASVSLIKANGSTFSWSCTRTKELINTGDPNCYHGQMQPIDWTIAKIKLNGSASGTNAMNETFSSTISNLIKDFHCSPVAQRPNFHPFIGGAIAYTPGTRLQRVIDFGPVTCDNAATLIINGQTYNITLY